MKDADRAQSCWIVGAIAGLIVMMAASGAGQTGGLAAAFLGFVTWLLMGASLVWFVCGGAEPRLGYDRDAGLPAPRGGHGTGGGHV